VSLKTTKTAVLFFILNANKREKLKMATNFPPVSKIFDDLDKFRDYCRFEGKPFDEADLYKKDSWVWQAYQKYQNYVRAKARNAGRNINTRRN
jgi:hypothetical protein